MGLIEQHDDEMEASSQLRRKLAAVSELTQRLNLEVKDIDFPEKINSLWAGPLDKMEAGGDIPRNYLELEWQPIRGPLFLNDLNSNIDYDSSSKGIGVQ
jgi:hypothetical protein